MLLNLDAQLMESLGMKPIHIVTVARRAANLKKMIEDKERPILSVEMDDGITVASETLLLEEKRRVAIQQVQLDAAERERELLETVSRQSMEIAALTTKNTELSKALANVKEQ